MKEYLGHKPISRLWNEKFSGRAVPKSCEHCNTIPSECLQPPSEQLHTPTSFPTALKTPYKEGELCMASIWGIALFPCVPDHTSVTTATFLLLCFSAWELKVSWKGSSQSLLNQPKAPLRLLNNNRGPFLQLHGPQSTAYVMTNN